VSEGGSGAAAEAGAHVEALSARYAALAREGSLAQWEAATGGGQEPLERSARARAALKALFSDADDARRVRAWLDDGAIDDPLLRRQLVLIDLEHTRSQLPRETIDDLARRTSELEHAFNTFRSTLHGEPVSNNRILEILRAERDEELRCAAWEASKQIGTRVAEPLRELVRRRNAAAVSLGFRDAYAMELRVQELDEETLFAVLDEFRDRTDEPFRRLREEMDREMAARFGVPPEALRPWHWEDPFAQEAPATAGVDLDAWFVDTDPAALSTAFFRGIGLPVDEVMARSDLYEREGKDQHAFCTDIDRDGDVRVLCNLRPDEYWTKVMLHELGHAVYDAYLPRSLPFLLRTPAHTLSTESVAMYMGRLTRDPAWLRDVVGAAPDAAEERAVRAQLRASMLVAARWILVMVYFERELYRDPDRADLDSLWWDLVERLQYVRRPDGRQAPDWAAKIHFSIAPVYYHNYLLGELMASQVSAALDGELGDRGGRSIAGDPRVGAFFRERVFAPGASVDWNRLLVHATGEALSPRFFVEDFV
jgi:peptidyl-dipeptidase A